MSVVGLAGGLVLEELTADLGRKRHRGDDYAGGAADLFGRKKLAAQNVFARRKLLPRAGAEQLAEDGQEQMAVDAVPTTAFEVIQSQFLLSFAEAVLDGPASEGDAEDHSQGPAVAPRDAVGKEEFDFVGEHVAGDDERALVADDPSVVSLSPAGGPADLPDFAAAVSVLDAITLRRLFAERR